MHKFINNLDITRKNGGQFRKTTGTKSETTGTIVPVVNMLKYALNGSHGSDAPGARSTRDGDTGNEDDISFYSNFFYFYKLS